MGLKKKLQREIFTCMLWSFWCVVPVSALNGAPHTASRLHDGACEAAAFLQQCEACLGERGGGLLIPEWHPSGWYT